MLEAFATGVAHQLLQLGHAGDGAVAERLQVVVGELAFADVGADDAARVVGRDAAVGERSRGGAAVESAPGVFDTEGGAEDGSVEDFDVGEK